MTAPAEPLRFVDPDVIGAEVSRSLVGGEVVDPVALNCELLRAVLWATTRDGPVHINRLLSLVVDLDLAYTTGADKEAMRGRQRKVLDALVEVGDVVELDQGRWSPTAPRIVDLGQTSHDRLFVGGVPASVLPDTLRGTLSHRDALRFVRGADLERALMLQIDSLDGWIGTPSVPLRDWARPLLATSLENYAEPTEGAQVYVYAPAASSRRNQHGRWNEPTACPNGRYLAKRTRIYGTPYRLVDVRGGAIAASGNVLMPGEGRRVMYALDAFANRQVEATIGQDGNEVRLTLWSDVPSAERRFFSLVGKVSSPADPYYPRSWQFPRRWDSEVRQRLAALEIRLLDR